MRFTKSGQKGRGYLKQSPSDKARKVNTKQVRRRLGWPKLTLDLNRVKHRRVLLLGMIGTGMLGLALLAGGYKSYSYTESAEFCGTVCHTMDPQFARYERSAHANVDCVECHIGPGWRSFIDSKIDGLHQVYALMTDDFSRPIKSPVHNLRPARETCENCHTPSSFKDNVIKTITHYDNDEQNTLIQSTLILKMGGWQESTGVSQGIHWHITNPVYYIPADEQRQVILWVGVEKADGSINEFFARDIFLPTHDSFVEDARQNGEIRKVDCIDCHNRTAHDIPTPERIVDEAISDNLISGNIPHIRSNAVSVLKTAYPSEAKAFQAIDGLFGYYEVAKPEVITEQGADVLNVISQLKIIYSSTNFPEMGMNWETNPNNETHTPTPGCFRCHDGNHVRFDEEGKEIETISSSCNLCHTVPIVGRGKNLLVETPVIVGPTPTSHSEFSWTIEHRNVSETELQDCYLCHGQGFCNNGICHNLSHPPDMLYSHAEEYRQQGEQVCYICHQDIHCSRCHPGGAVDNP